MYGRVCNGKNYQMRDVIDINNILFVNSSQSLGKIEVHRKKFFVNFILFGEKLHGGNPHSARATNYSSQLPRSKGIFQQDVQMG